jgi:murein DD-endopeptidase MepM/ murein hydrolase activator NlpD
MKKKLAEHYYVYKKKLFLKWEHLLHKGHGKMTVMFIPHNEKRIFNFQISKFTMMFFFFLFCIVIVVSSYAVQRNTTIKKQEEKLLMNYKDVRSQLFRFKKLSSQVADQIDDIKPGIENIYELAAGSEDSENIWQAHEASEDISAKEEKLRNLLPEEIFMLQQLQNDIISASQTIKTIKNFVDVRSRVINDTPSIIPNRGHITSLFGWRRSPFGFGRDFHTGIDIAAPKGTPIHVTAPGKVVTAGWGGGYGYMVRVRHKYGFTSLYGHCSKLAVKEGQMVHKGQVVGYVGQTGSSTGNHCHYEIRLGNVAINPYPYMSGRW